MALTIVPMWSVGTFRPRFYEHGFLVSGGTFTTIDVPGSLATLVTGINDKGELVGLWFDSNATHTFLASRH
jgi:hypothetical protein